MTAVKEDFEAEARLAGICEQAKSVLRGYDGEMGVMMTKMEPNSLVLC